MKTVKEKIKNALSKDIQTYNHEHNKKIDIFPETLDDIAGRLADLVNAINNDYSVFAICEKEPPSLDKGNHYFSVCYVKDNIVHKLWLSEAILLFDGKISKNRNLPRFVFCSGAIGMSRLFDATHSLFRWLSNVTGCKYFTVNYI